jgi:hypothetical protein
MRAVSPGIVLGVVALIAAPASAQSVSRIGGGFALGATPNLAEGLSSDQVCPKRSAVSGSARATFALTNAIQLEAAGEMFLGPPSTCVSAPIMPPPSIGTHSRRISYYDEGMTDPPTVVSLRVAAPLPNGDSRRLRPYLGIAHFTARSITTPVAGLTVITGGGQNRLLLEVEGWWYSVPKQHLEEDFVDGQLVRRSLTEKGIRTFTVIFRVGFTTPVGL